MKKFFKFISHVFGPLLGGGLISRLFSTKSFKTFKKPPFSPPAVAFPIVWSILYLLMGISIYIINKDEIDKKSTTIFIVQLIFNYVWSFLFFTFKLYHLSALWIIILLTLVIFMIDRFYRINKTAGLLQIPYFIWLLIALYLNMGVALLN